MDNPVIEVVLCYVGGALGGGLILAAIDMGLRRSFQWRNFVPDAKPIVGMLPPILFAMAFVYGRTAWTPRNLILAMAASGVFTYVVAMVLERSWKIRKHVELLEFTQYLVESVHTLEDAVRDGIVDGTPETIREQYVAWTRARSEKLRTMMEKHGTRPPEAS